MPTFLSPKPKFSPQAILALTEAITGGAGVPSKAPVGIYRSGPALERFFAGANVDLAIGNLSRVPAVHELLRRINNQQYGDTVISAVVEQLLDPREYVGQEHKLQNVVEHLNKFLKLDGFRIIAVGDRYRMMSLGQNTQMTNQLREKAAALDLDSVTRDFDRALAKAEDDPESAVTSACSTVESVCKCILESLGKPLPAKKDIGPLVGAVQAQLALSPGRKDIDEDTRRILSGLVTLTGGIGALRTHGGDAHGRGKAVPRLDARIARLAIHSASGLALFLLETWELGKGRKAS